MTKKSALLITKISPENQISGISMRIKQISDFLNEMDFEVEISSNTKLSRLDFYDLICISSFSNALQIFSARRKSRFLWFDAMDSWRVTRKSLFFYNPLLEVPKVLREILGRLFVEIPDLITYCSVRDANADQSNPSKTLIFGPLSISKFEPKDLGKRFVFVGPSGYFPNREAVKFLFRLARSGLFEHTKLHIFGDPREYKDTHPDVFIHGLSVDSQIYGKNDIHLVPIWRGAGVKYKCLIPLSLDIRVISTLEGANGFVPNPNLIVCTSVDEFKQALTEGRLRRTTRQDHAPLLELDQQEIVRRRVVDQIYGIT